MNLNTPIVDSGRVLKMYATRLAKIGIFSIEDFLHHQPARYEDYSLVSKIGLIQIGEVVTVQGKITEIKNQYVRRGKIKTIQRAVVEDETGKIELVWFNQPFLIKLLPVGATVSLSGKVEKSLNKKSIKSPLYEVIYDESKPIHTGRLVPIYPETKGISSKWLRRQIHNILKNSLDQIDEYMPDELLKRNNLLDFKQALKEVHFPSSLESSENAKKRISFDELFLMQLTATKRRKEWEKQNVIKPLAVAEYKKEVDKLINSLPFKLTGAQARAIDEILFDLSENKPMNRLLQGDVGAGKTIVGAIAMYVGFLNKLQSVFMAPTEILAKQHFETISKFLGPLGVKVEIVTGNTKYKIPNTKYDILVGTHAVLSEKIKFENLGIVIIDEQQRFGVEQRGVIRKKGTNPHLLTMTATPIPRTVALTMYGDLDLSYLDEMPKDRKIVKTWLVPPEKRNGAYDWIRKQIKETKSQVFIICPFIEESENMQTVKAATREYERLKTEIFPDLKLGLLHGKQKAKEKDEILQKFKQGKFDILVATPVVEVGIDIPNATIIMIEASERFGLAQLHQLRGRVGRSDKQSYCLLFTDNENALNSKRLKGMEIMHSGAELAELDLKLRGPGNIYGTIQHGTPKLKSASFSDTSLIKLAKFEADKILSSLSKYPKLQKKVEKISSTFVNPD